MLWLEDGRFKNERQLIRDPVCDMELDPTVAPAQRTIDGTGYYFCANGCRDEFERSRREERNREVPAGV